MLLAHKIELRPTSDQRVYFFQAAGVTRKAYNWALAEWKIQYEQGNSPNESALRRRLNEIKREEFPYMLDVTKAAPQEAIKQLGVAFGNFFRRVKRGQKPGYPRFKKRGIHDSFVATNGPPKKGADAAAVDGKRIKLPKIGWVKMRENVRFQGQIKQVTVSRTADKWYASLLIDTETLPHERKSHGSVGVDLGVKELAILSDGTMYRGAKPHKTLLRKLRKLNKALARSKRYRGEDGYWHDSQNRQKIKMRLAKLHARISNIRKDALHKVTTAIVLENSVIGLEDLNVSGMVRNRRLSRAIMDQSFYEFRRQIEYKAKLYGSEVVFADRWFPSSKMCSKCGAIDSNLSLGDRVYKCECGLEIDRDINAAINLRNLAVSSTESRNACGEGSSGIAHVRCETASMKQEFTSETSRKFQT